MEHLRKEGGRMRRIRCVVVLLLALLLLCSGCMPFPGKPVSPEGTVTPQKPTQENTDQQALSPDDGEQLPDEPEETAPAFDLKEYLVEGSDDLYNITPLVTMGYVKKPIAYGFVSDTELVLIYKRVNGVRDTTYSAKCLDLTTGELTEYLPDWQASFREPVDEEETPGGSYIQLISARPLVLWDYVNDALYRPDQDVVTVELGEAFAYADFSVFQGEVYCIQSGMIYRVEQDGSMTLVYTLPTQMRYLYPVMGESDAYMTFAVTPSLDERYDVYLDLNPVTGEQYFYTRRYYDTYFDGISGTRLYAMTWPRTDQEPFGACVYDSAAHAKTVLPFPDALDAYIRSLYETEVSPTPAPGPDPEAFGDDWEDAGQKEQDPAFYEDDSVGYYTGFMAASLSGDSLAFYFGGVDDAIGRLYYWDLSQRTQSRWEPEPREVYEISVSDYGDLSKWARQIGDRYGVEILFGENVPTEFGGYYLYPASNEDYLWEALVMLDEVLGTYPKGFFDAGEDGYVRQTVFYLTGGMSASPDALFTPSAVGLAMESDGLSAIALDVESYPLDAGTVYHEITHIIDNRLTYLGVLDEEVWSSLNPEDADYFYCYVDEYGRSYEEFADFSYTTYSDAYYNGDYESVYFYDDYAKTFPTEDRARLMEYLLGYYDYVDPGYRGSHVQKKLAYYFQCIREGFDTTGWPERTIWEQRLYELQQGLW